MGERGFSEIILSADPRQSRSRRLYRAGEVTAVCGDLATVRVDVDDAGGEVCLPGLQVLGPWSVQVGDWVELGYLDDHPNSAYVRSPLFSETRNPALGFKARVTVGDWDAVVDVSGGGDYTDIQAALDGGHKTILVRKGTYSLSAAGISITAEGVAIAGESWQETILDFGGSANYINVASAAKNCALRNLKIVNSQNTTYGAVCVGARRCLVEHCWFDSNYRHVHGGSDGHEYWIALCYMNAAGAGGVCHFEAGHGTFLGNNVLNSVERSFRLGWGGDRIMGNRLFYCHVDMPGWPILVQANYMGNSRLTTSGQYNTIIGNFVGPALGDAVVVSGADCTVQGNYIYDPAGKAIYVSGNLSTIAGNSCYSAGASGIVVSGARNIVQGNRSRDNANYGVHVMSGAVNNIVANNVCNNNTSGQIQNDGAGTLLDNNITS